MDATVPRGAAILLDFVSQPESCGDYNTIIGNHQNTLPHPITAMTLDALMAAQLGWAQRWNSSAAGRYQAMHGTLTDARPAMKLTGKELFAPDLQDRIGCWLLKRRGYAAFMARQLSAPDFAKHLAQEWASLPVLVSTQGAHRPITRGQSYYAGDGLNHALVNPADVEAVLIKALARGT